MASQPQPGSSTCGTMARTPPPPASVKAPAYRAYVQKCPVLLDWWLEREKGEGGKIRVAGYTTRNRAARVFTSDSITMRHADGTLETADGVTVLIRGPLNITRMHQNGFPYEVSKWFKLGFPVEWEKHANSNMKPTNAHDQSPLKSTEYYIEKFLHGSFINSMGYAFTGNDFNTSKGFTGNTDGPPTQRLSTLSNGTPRIQESTGNTGDNDNSMSKMAAYEELCNASMDMHEESFTNPGETCTNGQADNQQFGVVQGSEDNTISRLRNGKVFGVSSGASLKNSYSKGKTMQHETFNSKMISNEEITHPADLMSHENVNKSLNIQDKAKQLSARMPISPEPRRTRSGHVHQVVSWHQKDAHNVAVMLALVGGWDIGESFAWPRSLPARTTPLGAILLPEGVAMMPLFPRFGLGVAGWGTPEALHGLGHCRRRRRPQVPFPSLEASP